MREFASRSRMLSCRFLLWLCIAAWPLLAGPAAFANDNTDNQLRCRPNFGINFLINNGATSPSNVFRAHWFCFDTFLTQTDKNTINLGENQINTTQGGQLNLVAPITQTAQNAIYAYTPPSPGFTGLDTFTFHVLTVYNDEGGPGSQGGTRFPGGPADLTITLNVLPAVTTMTAASDSGPVNVPIPAGSISGCQADQGNPGEGTPPGIITGCVAGGSENPDFIVTPADAPRPAQPQHGTLTQVTPTTLQYTPDPGYLGPDSFGYYALGMNTQDIPRAGFFGLYTGPITMNVMVVPAAPTLSPWAIALLAAGLLLIGARLLRGRLV
jgi:hypothetical protein